MARGPVYSDLLTGSSRQSYCYMQDKVQSGSCMAWPWGWGISGTRLRYWGQKDAHSHQSGTSWSLKEWGCRIRWNPWKWAVDQGRGGAAAGWQGTVATTFPLSSSQLLLREPSYCLLSGLGFQPRLADCLKSLGLMWLEIWYQFSGLRLGTEAWNALTQKDSAWDFRIQTLNSVPRVPSVSVWSQLLFGDVVIK